MRPASTRRSARGAFRPVQLVLRCSREHSRDGRSARAPTLSRMRVKHASSAAGDGITGTSEAHREKRVKQTADVTAYSQELYNMVRASECCRTSVVITT